jgi:NADH-quinone oxidoreductase subunit J
MPMEFLYLFLLSLLLINSFLVFLSKNPVYSVLFLILVFCNAASILIILHIEFLALLYIIIYVGAIAVLFLFVVMMLNVKIKKATNLYYLLTLVFFNIIFLFVLYSFLDNVFSFFKINAYINFNPDFFIVNVDNLSNIFVFGQVLYNYYLICFLLVGILLLVAMIGAIVLTLNFQSNRKNEIVFKQLSRSDNILSFIQ